MKRPILKTGLHDLILATAAELRKPLVSKYSLEALAERLEEKT